MARACLPIPEPAQSGAPEEEEREDLAVQAAERHGAPRQLPPSITPGKHTHITFALAAGLLHCP